MTSSKHKHGRVCPHQGAFLLDNWIRRILQPPDKLLQAYIKPGDTAIDLGCGPGFFTMAMARLVGPVGHVTAVDLQVPMLAHVRKKAARQGVADRITCHRCQSHCIGLDISVDFILACYMVHETPDPAEFFKEVRTLLKNDGRLLVVEPKMHVSRVDFDAMQADARAAGLVERAPFKSLLSRGVLLGLS